MKFRKKKLEAKESKNLQYYFDDLEEIDWEEYYGENYGESWL